MHGYPYRNFRNVLSLIIGNRQGFLLGKRSRERIKEYWYAPYQVLPDKINYR